MPILKSRQKLDLSYIPPRVLCRDKEINLLKTLISSGGKAVVSGDIGTGKTMLARYLFKDAIYVNCFVNRSEHAILESILSEVKPNFNPAGLPTRKLWEQLPDNIFIILDEIEGISLDDMNHFLYTLSRRSEYGRRLRYIAITRDANILRQMIGDDATWSTFAEKAVVQFQFYTHRQMMKILDYRAQEALYEGTFDKDILSLIADIAIESRGHMRTAIDILRNSAMLAEQKGKTMIGPEDVREVNLDIGISGLDILDNEHLLALLAVSSACSRRAYSTLDEIKREYVVKCENYGLKPGEIEPLISKLELEGFVYRRDGKYGLFIPSNSVIREASIRLQNSHTQ